MQLSSFEYKPRIKETLSLLGNNAMLLIAQPTAVRNRSVGHPYRQCSFLNYLTGFNEPECALVVNPRNAAGKQVAIFVREKDKIAEMWSGKRLGVQAAKEQLPVDIAFSTEELWEKLPDLLRSAEGLYFELGRDESADRKVIETVKAIRAKTKNHMIPILDSEAIASELRIHKDKQEIERMQVAAGITKKTFDEIFKQTRPGMSEKDVYGIILGEFLKNGADMEAYSSIVAGGKNACILHYIENNKVLDDNTLLLVDAGAQFEYYASDVTRTFPVGKKFTSAQKSAYEIVLEAQKNAIAAAQPGSTLDVIHRATVDTIVEGLKDLRILEGSKDEIIDKQLYKEYFPHTTSHWIGMDVHDVGYYHVDGDHRKLEAGMYFSVEPGLYFSPENYAISEEFRGIGIRIEDDILITDNGHLNLTEAIPKQISELEDRF